MVEDSIDRLDAVTKADIVNNFVLATTDRLDHL